MNKKGAIIYWILFGIVGAIALFYTLTADIDTNVAAKGTWPLSFLKDNYHPAQRELLVLQLKAADLGKITAVELAAHGGIDPQQESACGSVNATPLWNKAKAICFPHEIENAQKLLSSAMRGFEFDFEKNFLIGKGAVKKISSTTGTYFYREEFVVDLGYSFDEYNQIKQEAQSLLAICTENVAACLTEKKPAHWHYLSCTSEAVIPADTPEIVFCVESPSKAKINGELVQYHFALDFSEGTEEPANIS